MPARECPARARRPGSGACDRSSGAVSWIRASRLWPTRYRSDGKAVSRVDEREKLNRQLIARGVAGTQLRREAA
jgi:hypothetical protein